MKACQKRFVLNREYVEDEEVVYYQCKREDGSSGICKIYVGIENWENHLPELDKKVLEAILKYCEEQGCK